MKNKDITEWILDEGIDPLTHIKNSKGQNIFLADILEKHLKEQLCIHSVIGQSELLKAFLDWFYDDHDHWNSIGEDDVDEYLKSL